MLEIQRFLKTHRVSWKQVLSEPPYCLKIKEKDSRVLFKYSQIDSDFSNPIVQEARGLILEKDTWQVVSISFNKFFNIQEPLATQIDWVSAIGEEKLDGTLFTVYNYKHKWHVKTNGTIDAEDAEIESPLFDNYRQLFDLAADNCGLDFSKLNPLYAYSFELCSLYNQVVIKYNQPKLYHILTRCIIFPYTEVEEDIGIEKPKVYKIVNERECLNLVKEMNGEYEGIVVRDKNFNRIKVKTEEWLRLHYLTNAKNTSTDSLIIKTLENDVDELLSYFPKYEEKIEEIKQNFIRLQLCVDKDLQLISRYKNKERAFIATIVNNWGVSHRMLFWLLFDEKVDKNIKMWDNKVMLRVYHKFFD